MRNNLEVFHVFTVSGSPLFKVSHLWHNNGNDASSQRITVDHALGNVGRKGEDVFNFFWGDVFTLRQLKNVLASVNDLNRAVRVDLADVTGFEPSILESFFRNVWTLVVAGKDSVSFHAKLSTWIGLVS